MSEVVQVANCGEQGRIGDVVFVHGLNGDPLMTWQLPSDANTFWPKWLGEESPTIGVWSLGFEAASSKWNGTTMALVDRATNLLAQLEAFGIGGRPLVFVAHSLGGLVVKQMLRHGEDYGNPKWKRISANTVGVTFLATPHAGSSLATFIRLFGIVYRPTASVEDLREDDPHLRDLNTWYRNNVSNLGIDTLIFRENLKTNGVLVVPPSTSDPGLQGVVPIPVDTDHIGICKPTSRKGEVYVLTKQFIIDRLSAAANGSSVVAPRTNDFFVDIDILNAYPPIPYLKYEDLEDEEMRGSTDAAIAEPSTTLRYDLQRDASGLTIAPKMPYLEDLSKGGPIYGIEYTWTPFRWQFPNLDFKVVNNSSKIVCLTEAIFSVAASAVDPTPIPVIPLKRTNSMNFSIKNEGWGAMEDATLDLNLFPTDHGEDFDTPYKHHLTLETIDEGWDIKLAQTFATLGVTVMPPEDERHGPYVEEEGLGPFTDGYAIMCGKPFVPVSR